MTRDNAPWIKRFPVNQTLDPHWTADIIKCGDKFKKYPFNWYGCVILPLHALKYPELEWGDQREEISFFFTLETQVNKMKIDLI